MATVLRTSNMKFRTQGLASRDQLRNLLVWDSTLHCVCPRVTLGLRARVITCV